MFQSKEHSLLHERLYWRERFLNFTGETEILLDYKRPLSWRGDYDVVECCFPDSISSKFNALTNKHDLSLFILFASAWAILLRGYTGASIVVFATPAYIQGDQETSVSNNVIPLKVNVDDRLSIKELILQVRASLLEAFKYQSLEYQELLSEIGMQKKRNRSVLFSNIISLERVHKDPDKNAYKSDLFLRFLSENDKMGVKIEFNKDLFHYETIKHLSLHLNQIFSTISMDVNLLIKDISYLTGDENNFFKSQLQLESKNKKDVCIHSLFEEVAALYPNKIAIEFQNQTLTYRDLNGKANEIAYMLTHQQKVKAGTFVGFIGERGIEYCAAILGILKAGCAFVPIDSSYPVKRIATILKDSQLEVVLASQSSIHNISNSPELSNPQLKWVEIKTEERRYDGWTSCNNITAQYPAYMIYTSGSTGTPKGVVIRHDGKMNHILASHKALSLGQNSNCLFSASISTDISIWQVFVALLCGGKTVIIDNETLFDHQKFLYYIETKNINVMQFVPSFIQAFLLHLDDTATSPPQLSQNKLLILSGEEVQPKLINAWFKWFSQIPILNAYGPSEASDIVSQEFFFSPINPHLNHVLIGSPLLNIQLFVLNKDKKIQPFYVPGEIYIAGIAVGNGYWRDNEKTELAFIDHPFDPNIKDKWYRTGDYGRMFPNGKIEYLGRMDTQVKIRGFRVELGEIEQCLQELETVKQSKSIVKFMNNQDVLCTYVVLKVPENDSTKLEKMHDFLKQYLRTCLPDYMVPSYIHFMERLPTLPGGKVDISSLPNPNVKKNHYNPIPPRNELEKKLATILATTIGLPQDSISMESNFFDLGGTSIHLMALKYQVKEQLGIDITIELLFRFSAIQELAAYITEECLKFQK